MGTFCCTLRSVSHSANVREESSAVDENEHRDPQLGNVPRVRNLGTLSSKWMPLPNSLLGAQGAMQKRR